MKSIKYQLSNNKIVTDNGLYFYNRPLYMKNQPFVGLSGDKPAIKMVDTKAFCSSIVPSIKISEQFKKLRDFENITTHFMPNITEWLVKDDTGTEVIMVAVSLAEGNGVSLKVISNKDSEIDLVNYLNTKERKTFTNKPTDRNDPSLCGDRIKFPCDVDDDFISNLFILRSDTPLYVCITPSEDKIAVVLQKDDKEFNDSIKRAIDLTKIIKLDTPDSYLSMTVNFSSMAQDAIYHDNVYHHGAMAWNNAYPGWRSIYGASVLGWHKNVINEAEYYIAYQVKESPNILPSALDEHYLGTIQYVDSVYFGKGHIAKDQCIMYNFQTQFFDQLIHSWRWTNDKNLEKILYPALKLHSEWQQKCFDSNEDGLYESYINSWPTDSVWANGGDCPEETTYAYSVNIALSEMARNAGEMNLSKEYDNRAQKIKTALLKELWISDRGYVGFYREAQGEKRLHKDSWLYSIFLPIDAGILDENEAAQALYYTEYGLERVKDDNGGELVYLSNFVPYVWSIRVIQLGDVLHLALAYFQIGLFDDGWKLLKGVYREGCYHERIPGGFKSDNTSTDFGDIVSMYNRVIVEGLYGIRTNYPQGYIDIKPSFPIEWEEAKINTPEYEYVYTNTCQKISIDVKLPKKAQINLTIPLKATEVLSLMVNDNFSDYEIVEGFGIPLLKLSIDSSREFSLNVDLQGEFLYQPEEEINVGRERTIEIKEKIIHIEDPQNIIKEHDEDGKIVFNEVYGNHMFLVNVMRDGVRYKRNIKLKFPKEEFMHKGIEEIPTEAMWSYVDLKGQFNSDIREIYKKKYKNTNDVSGMLKLGVDGFSPWTFGFWNAKPPEMDFSLVNINDSGRIVTDFGVEFKFNPEGENIVFVSKYDNFPNSYKIDINEEGKGIFLLVSGSTNSMQTRIANARIILNYCDNSEEYIDIVPPFNFWSVCGYKDSCNLGGDYPTSKHDFTLDGYIPNIVQFGNNCRGVVLSKEMKPNTTLKSIEIKSLSQEIVVGIMGVTMIK